MTGTKLFSSLFLTSQMTRVIFSVLQPRYNAEYYRRLLLYRDNLKTDMARREKLDKIKSLDNLEEDINEMLRLRNIKNRSEEDDRKLWAQEEKVMPCILAIPNKIHKSVADSDIVVDIIKPQSDTKMPSRMLDHIKLSYINKCIYKSVVGPHSQYYYDIGAKVQLAIFDFFSHQLETKQNFEYYSGLSLVKSAVVEAVNSYEDKNFYDDCCRIIENPSNRQGLFTHLVETSRESCAAFISRCHLNKGVNEPLRLMSSGASYRASHENQLVKQIDIVYCMSLTSSREKESTQEFLSLRNLIWDCYIHLAVPCRIVHCGAPQLKTNEYDAYRIDIWLPSNNAWIPVARISNYLDYITSRLNLSRGHIIDAVAVDSSVLFAGIMENNQNLLGKFKIPLCLKDHSIGLTKTEERNYFYTDSSEPCLQMIPASRTLHNYTSKRYLAKRSLFAHSKRFQKNSLPPGYMSALLITLLLFFATMADWKIIYKNLPEWLRRFIYNYVYRSIVRPLVWFITEPNEVTRPANDYYDDYVKRKKELEEASREVRRRE